MTIHYSLPFPAVVPLSIQAASASAAGDVEVRVFPAEGSKGEVGEVPVSDDVHGTTLP
jgi:hypothetical protein